MAASARTTLVETGANNLYLTLGSLVWCIDGYWVRSPLILIPVNLEQEDDTYGIVLDEAGASTPNHSLLTRFKADTGVDLVELREPVRDEHGIDVKATLDSLRRRLRRAGRRGVASSPPWAWACSASPPTACARTWRRTGPPSPPTRWSDTS